VHYYHISIGCQIPQTVEYRFLTRFSACYHTVNLLYAVWLYHTPDAVLLIATGHNNHYLIYQWTLLKNYQAALTVAKAQYQKLLSGNAPEDIQIYEDAKRVAEQDLRNTYTSAVNTLIDAYTKAYTALNKIIDQGYLAEERSICVAAAAGLRCRWPISLAPLPAWIYRRKI